MAVSVDVRLPHASVNLVYHIQHRCYVEEKRREQNLIVRSSKSEAEVIKNIEDHARRIVGLLLKLTTDRHEASRGLSATADLRV